MTPIHIYPGTGRVVIAPPTMRGKGDLPPCPPQNVRLRVRRQGKPAVIAEYAAMMQGSQWHFTIDAAWQTARPGFYMADVLCCTDVIGCYRFWLTRTRPGEVSTVDMKHDPCADLSQPSCPTPTEPCPAPACDPCNYAPAVCGAAPVLATGAANRPDCATHLISCPD